MNGISQRRIVGNHFRLELIKRDAQVIRHVNGGDKLPDVLESAGSVVDCCSCRKQRLEFRVESRIPGNLGCYLVIRRVSGVCGLR